MKEITQAIEMLRNLMVPKEGFRWGSVVYEPDESDQSAAAQLKRQLIQQANRTIELAKAFMANPKSASPMEFNEDIFDEIETMLESDAESKEFSDLAAYTENLVQVVNHRIRSK